MAILKATHLAKSYKSRQVVRDVSLEVESGQIVGLLGPNGAGKTTTFYMIVGIVPLDKGEITLDQTHSMIHTRRFSRIVIFIYVYVSIPYIYIVRMDFAHGVSIIGHDFRPIVYFSLILFNRLLIKSNAPLSLPAKTT